MTALAGLWDRAGGATSPRCARMLEAQAIYGGREPSVLRTAGEISVGRRLFRLTDEDDQDRGPASGAAGALLLIADTRIDNRAELIGALGLAAAEARGLADPALLMRVIERWGLEGVARVLGPFALALWDARERSLSLARDFLGERPLHYHLGGDFVAFASMPRGLHALPEVPYAADLASAADLLAIVPETGEDSLFEQVRRVVPGTIVSITAQGVQSRHYWRPRAAPLRLRSDGDYAEALREQLDRAVARRLRGRDGAIGAHLSGGLDSAAVAATAAMQLAPGRLLAFTAVPEAETPTPAGTFGDEGPLAAATAARHANIEHIRVRSGGTSPVALLDRQFQLFQRPVLNPVNAVWFEAINDTARARGVRVLLTGQMGNFTLSHAGRERLPVLLRAGRVLALLRLAWQMSRNGAGWPGLAAATFGPYLPRPVWRRLARVAGRAAPTSSCSAVRGEALAAFGVARRAAERGLDLDHRPWADGRAMRLWGLGRVDLGAYNKGVLGGWGIDLRDPTADRELIEFALSVPEEQFVLAGVPRSLARRAFADRLPQSVLAERRRGFQAADWHRGMAAALGAVAEELDGLERCRGARELIDLDGLRAALAQWPAEGWNRPAVHDRYALAMMRGVATGHFLRRVAGSN